MIEREKNKEIAKSFITSSYWQAEYHELFSDSYHFDFPSAPPGMPQSFVDSEVENFMEWMARTVKRWDVDLEEIHGIQNNCTTFWAVGWVDADVFWGMYDGHFHSKFIARIEVAKQRVYYMKLMMDPLKFLDAAGRTYPLFRMDLNHPDVEEMIRAEKVSPHSKADDSPAESSSDPQERIQGNLDAFRTPEYWQAVSHDASYSKDLKAYVWFLPPEMDSEYPPEMQERVDAWSMLSCPEIDFSYSGLSYKADDADIYFGEYYCKGFTRWLGNGMEGRYRNQYFYILRMNKDGEITVSEEFLNPVNKMNSINVSIPSFPYYL